MEHDGLPQATSVVGRVLANRYLVEDVHERTPTSVFFRVYHLELDRQRLLRMLPERSGLSRAACQRALQIGHRVSAVETPHVARTLDVGWFDGRFPFLVCELLRGGTLQAATERGGVTLGRVLAVGRQLAGALQRAHAVGITHGAVSPDCCWIEPPGVHRERARLLAFGQAALPSADGDDPKSGVYPSAPSGLLSLDDRPGFRAEVRQDIHSLGAALEHFAAATDASRPECSLLVSGLTAVLQRCGYVPPDDGYDHVGQLARDLAALQRMTSDAPAARPRGPITAVHHPARATRLGTPAAKVIVQAG